MGRLYLYIDEQFACVAQCPELSGIDRREWAIAAKSSQKRKMAELSKEYRRFGRELKDNIPEIVLAHRVKQSQKLAAFPKPEQTHTSPGLDAAQQALDARNSLELPAPEQTSAQILHHEKFQREFERSTQIQQEDDSRRIHARFIEIDQDITSGKRVSPADTSALNIYKKSGQWAAMQQFFNDFGLTANDF